MGGPPGQSGGAPQSQHPCPQVPPTHIEVANLHHHQSQLCKLCLIQLVNQLSVITLRRGKKAQVKVGGATREGIWVSGCLVNKLGPSWRIPEVQLSSLIPPGARGCQLLGNPGIQAAEIRSYTHHMGVFGCFGHGITSLRKIPGERGREYQEIRSAPQIQREEGNGEGAGRPWDALPPPLSCFPQNCIQPTANPAGNLQGAWDKEQRFELQKNTVLSLI